MSETSQSGIGYLGMNAVSPHADPITGTKEGPGESAYFMAVNRNKKSIGLSFQHEEGVKILHELAKTSDVLVENYIPGMISISVSLHADMMQRRVEEIQARLRVTPSNKSKVRDSSHRFSAASILTALD